IGRKIHAAGEPLGCARRILWVMTGHVPCHLVSYDRIATSNSRAADDTTGLVVRPPARASRAGAAARARGSAGECVAVRGAACARHHAPGNAVRGASDDHRAAGGCWWPWAGRRRWRRPRRYGWRGGPARTSAVHPGGVAVRANDASAVTRDRTAEAGTAA